MASKDKDRLHFNDFKEVYLFILSIVHGGLFFILLEHLNKILYKGVNHKNIALTLFLFTLFLRIFQSQLLAALKYRSWRLYFIDLFVVFTIATLEHQIILFSSNNDVSNFVFLVRAMAVLGILGYLYTYIKIKKYSSGREGILHSINIFVILFILLLSFINAEDMHIFYYLSTILLVVNMHTSFLFSGYLK